MKRLIAVLMAILVLMVVPACNTTKGVGKDIEKAGAGIERSADKHGAE